MNTQTSTAPRNNIAALLNKNAASNGSRLTRKPHQRREQAAADDDVWEMTPELQKLIDETHEEIRQGRYIDLVTPEDVDRFVDRLMA